MAGVLWSLCHGYDGMNCMLSEQRYLSGDTIYYEYDARGAQTSVKKTGIGDEAFQYDDAGRLIRHTQWGSEHIYFSYDPAGNRTVMINPDAPSLIGRLHHDPSPHRPPRSRGRPRSPWPPVHRRG